MAENVPPGSANQSNNAADQPGRPYYESLRATLRQTIEKKRKLDEQIAAVEEQIFKAEGSYLEDTAGSGNIVRGFDGWVKGVQVGGRGAADDRRRGRVRDDDRVFSRSSVSWMKAQDGSDSNPTSHAPTPTASLAGGMSTRDTNKTGNKKKRAADKDDDEDGKTMKRGKISYGRD
ncbi:uncharacterized protein LTR77_004006 [Saxophila tyrrhenica]|uniref:Chromatin modification-related protein EAF6 n=1 Tax=Saxophila tyrrhenica TaxID=1690608 RepID=A0AAV9PJH2_9PEZI|nr:hypothetical protein LTR77_004006 [Saxophila tyrrhenica]